MAQQVRVFVAVEPDEALIAALARLQDVLRQQPGADAVRWVRPKGIHLTLKFLGEIATHRLGPVQRAVDAACERRRAFSLSVGGLGCFPNVQQPRVVWVALHDDEGRLATLQQGVDAALQRAGFPAEQRPFRAHLTLGRVRRDASRSEASRLGEALAACEGGPLGSLEVAEVCVVRSDLQPSGAVYTTLHQAPLRGEGDAL